MTESILAVWQLQAKANMSALVIPDGCRDLIFRQSVGGRPNWFVSSLADHSYHVPIAKGDVFVGYRLRPGVSVNEMNLVRSLRDDEPTSAEIVSKIGSHTSLSQTTAEIMECLASRPGSVAEAASRLGVGLRTLQRTALEKTGFPPIYWLQLARVRAAGQALCGLEPLAELALAHGFADQAHMSREFRRWFGITPSTMRKGGTHSKQLDEPGFAT